MTLRRAFSVALGGSLSVLGAACLWADDQPIGPAPFIDYGPMCERACQALGVCAAGDSTVRPFDQGHCEAYCNQHSADRQPSGYRPVRQAFAVRFYSAYADGELTCSSFRERLGMSQAFLEKLQSELFVGAPEAKCAELLVRDCGATEAAARDTCFFEMGILYVEELSTCVVEPQTCASAAMCRRDAARAAGWVEADKPWLGPPP